MDENDKTSIVENPATVPNYVHQSDMARADMANKRMFILCIVELVIIIAMAVAFFIYESNVQEVVIEQDVETDDGISLANGMGDLYYGPR